MFGWPGGVCTTFGIDVRTRGWASPPYVVCALWPAVVLSDDTRCLSERVRRGGKRLRRGGEMSQSPKTSAATPGVVEDAEPTVVGDAVSHAPVFITEQEVVFSTAAATSPRPASISRRLI